jgi:hypothetical protein
MCLSCPEKQLSVLATPQLRAAKAIPITSHLVILTVVLKTNLSEYLQAMASLPMLICPFITVTINSDGNGCMHVSLRRLFLTLRD